MYTHEVKLGNKKYVVETVQYVIDGFPCFQSCDLRYDMTVVEKGVSPHEYTKDEAMDLFPKLLGMIIRKEYRKTFREECGKAKESVRRLRGGGIPGNR